MGQGLGWIVLCAIGAASSDSVSNWTELNALAPLHNSPRDGTKVTISLEAGLNTSDFDSDVILSGSGTELTIIGYEGAVLDAHQRDRFFEVSGGATLRLQGPIMLRSGKSCSGGAIFAEGSSTTLIVQNCVFDNNQAVDGCDHAPFGGAVSLKSGATATIRSSIFVGNSARSCGGAISAIDPGTQLIVQNSTFHNNEAGHGGHGGAMYLRVAVTATIISSVFVGNSAIGRAAAIDLGDSSTKAVVKHCEFRNNIGTEAVLVFSSAVVLMVEPNCTGDKFAVHDGNPGTILSACDEGQFASNASVVQTTDCGYLNGHCAACNVGSYRSLNTTTLTLAAQTQSCTSCPAGSFATDAIIRSSAENTCSRCSAGQFSTDGQTCKDCPSGKYAPSGGYKECIGCESGQFQPHQGQRSCFKCESGLHQPSQSKLSCDGCPPGSVTNTLSDAGASTCSACDRGTFSSISTTACSDCAPGRYSNDNSTTACRSCEQGRYQSANGRLNCVACSAGYHGIDSASKTSSETECRTCIQGKYQAEEGQHSCLQCAEGQYITEDGKAACKLCTAKNCAEGEIDSCGTQQTKWASFGTCLRCEPGQFLNKNSSQCAKCPSSYFSAEAGKSSCTMCSKGRYQNEPAKSYCNQVENGFLVRKVDGGFVPWPCPTGISCNGVNRSYDGHVWHSPTDEWPETSSMHTCVNDGCPEQGASVMQCQRGYRGPLCALCERGYYQQLRSCVRCEKPRLVSLVGFLLALLVFLAGLVYGLARYSHFVSSSVLSHVKILVAFFTIVATIDTQFGVMWPINFLQALAFVSALTFDLSVLSSAFCLYRVNYYVSLIFSTASLVIVIAALAIAARWKPSRRDALLRTGIYVVLFAYPVVAVKVCETFLCHRVDGVSYLRADYSLECGTSEWYAMAGYSSLFLVFYVVGIPACLLMQLYGYRDQFKQRKTAPRSLRLSFLCDDYKLVYPLFLWECEEMLRKLLFSVVGAFWSNKSAAAIATAVLFAICFLVLQYNYKPYRSNTCNRLQQSCLFALLGLYFGGLLLKVEVVEAADKKALGVLLVLVLVSVLVTVVVAIVLEVHSLVKGLRIARYCSSVLKTLPTSDPPDNSAEFYSVQIPIEPTNLGSRFAPKNPEQLAMVSAAAALKVVRQLSDENVLLLQAFIDKIKTKWTIPLSIVRLSEVDKGKICVKYSRKTEESILAKARRPAILAKNPQFGIAHVRDTFRFKAVVFSFSDMLQFIWALCRDRNICPDGMHPKSVEKLDVEKLTLPKEWGWRFVAFDMRMPNHQICECYIVFDALEAVKKNECPSSLVCPQLSNHEIFEKWRIRDVAKLQSQELEEYELDRKESNRRYDVAWVSVLSHTSTKESNEFWRHLKQPSTDTAPANNIGTAVEHRSEDNPLHVRQLSSTKSGVGFTNPSLDWAVDSIQTLKMRRSGGNLTSNNPSRVGGGQDEDTYDEPVEAYGESGSNRIQQAAL